MSFIQRLSKIKQIQQPKEPLQKQTNRMSTKQSVRDCSFEKNHSDLKSILSFLEKDRGSSLCCTPEKKRSSSLRIQQWKADSNKNLAKQNIEKIMKTDTKQFNEKSPQRVNKVRINKFSEGPKIFEDLPQQKKKTARLFKRESNINPENILYQTKFSVHSETLSNSKQLVKKKGIPNIGNTCYMQVIFQIRNAVLQCLFHCKGFNQELLKLCDDNESVLGKYSDLYSAVMYHGDNKIISALPLKMSVCTQIYYNVVKVCSMFANYHQQDAHEFLKKLLQAIHLELLSSVKSTLSSQVKAKNTFIDDSFSGQLYNYVICSSCGKQTKCIEKFMELSLAVRKGTRKTEKIEQIIEAYFEKEIIEDLYDCDFCKRKCSNGQKRCELIKSPPYLVLHLKNYNQGLSLPPRVTVPKYLSFPPNSKSPKNYQLQGMVLHRGGLEGGHYTSYVKHDQDWYIVDDDKVTVLGNVDVENMTSKGLEKVYILFYRAV